MPWKQTSPMGERVRFIAAMLEGEATFVEPLKNELIGLDEVDDDQCKVFFGHLLIGMLDARNIHMLRNRRTFGSMVRADGEIQKRYRRRKPLPPVSS